MNVADTRFPRLHDKRSPFAESRSSNKALIRIVYVISAIKNGGPNRVLEAMVDNIDTKVYEVHVVSLLGEHDETAVKAITGNQSVRYYNLGLTKKADILKHGPRLLFELFTVIKPNIIHSHGLLPDIVVGRVKSQGVLVSTVHSNLSEDYFLSFGRIRGFLFSKLHFWVLKKFKAVVFCSGSVYESLNSKLNNSYMVRNGFTSKIMDLSFEQKNLRKTLGISKSDKIFIFVGSLIERKGIIELLDMFSNNHKSNEHLIILGRGYLRERCEAYVSKHIHLVGFKDNVSDYLSISDVYVSASKSEGMSISVIEALSRGLYLLMSDIPSHREVVDIDKRVFIGGLFTDNNSFRNMKEAIMTDSLSKSVPQLYHEKYLSGRVMMSGYEKLYKEIMKDA